MAALMKGAACAKAIRSGIEASVELLRAQKIQPGLGILRIGARTPIFRINLFSSRCCWR